LWRIGGGRFYHVPQLFALGGSLVETARLARLMISRVRGLECVTLWLGQSSEGEQEADKLASHE
jgi:hypothetical protein